MFILMNKKNIYEHFRKVKAKENLYNPIIIPFKKLLFTISELPSICLFLYYIRCAVAEHVDAIFERTLV